MFNKLLANLPFNPSLVAQISFYGKRLRQESSVRRAGLIFVALALVVQVFAVISPPQPTLARSANDLIDGGIGSKQQAVADCQNNIANYGDILAYYNITCNNVANTATVSIRSTDYNRQLYSMGRLPYGKAGETPVNINGKTYWNRYLWSWDTYAYSSYTALKGVSGSGMTFFILYNCGNLVFIGLPAPPARCIWNPSLFASDANCLPPRCALDNSLLASNPACQSCPYKPTILKGNPLCVGCPYPGLTNITKDNPLCIAPCPYNSTVNVTSPQCKPCAASQTRDDKTACLELSKTASNLTQNITDANGTTAQAGDVIRYTLTVKNTGKAEVPKFVIQENINDILDYGEAMNLNGGTLDNNQILSWPPQNIKANQSIQAQFTIKVKNPIPQTPVSSTDAGHFDLTMTNVYGNTVNIKLPPSVTKVTEQIVKTLPNTGPGTSLTTGFLLILVVGYFWARSRLLAKETDIIRSDYAQQGGV